MPVSSCGSTSASAGVPTLRGGRRVAAKQRPGKSKVAIAKSSRGGPDCPRHQIGHFTRRSGAVALGIRAARLGTLLFARAGLEARPPPACDGRRRSQQLRGRPDVMCLHAESEQVRLAASSNLHLVKHTEASSTLHVVRGTEHIRSRGAAPHSRPQRAPGISRLAFSSHRLRSRSRSFSRATSSYGLASRFDRTGVRERCRLRERSS